MSTPPTLTHARRQSDIANVKEALPGIQLRCLAASMCFYIPIYRDILLAGGVCDASRYNARHLLHSGDVSVVLVPGGATEALYSGIGRNTVYLKRRLGFVRLAMQAGVPIVPVYSFGENDTYTTLSANHAVLHRLQKKFQRIFGISLPLLTHIFPRKTEINVVFGRAFEVPHNEAPTNKEVLVVLAEYEKRLKELFDEHKDVYAKERIEELTVL